MSVGDSIPHRLTVPALVTVKAHRRRRSKFRDAKCAWTTFIHGGALTCGRMMVTVEASPARGPKHTI